MPPEILYCSVFCIFCIDAYYSYSTFFLHIAYRFFAQYYSYYAYFIACILCLFSILQMHILHIVRIHNEKILLQIFIVYCRYCLVPIPGPSCSYTTYNQHRRLLIYRSQLRESLPILVAWRRVSVAPTTTRGRTLESHTRLVIVLGAPRRQQIDTDPSRLRSITNQNMQNM